MTTSLRAFTLLVLSLSLTGGIFLFATAELGHGAEAVDPIETSIRAAHADPPAHVEQA